MLYQMTLHCSSNVCPQIIPMQIATRRAQRGTIKRVLSYNKKSRTWAF